MKNLIAMAYEDKQHHLNENHKLKMQLYEMERNMKSNQVVQKQERLQKSFDNLQMKIGTQGTLSSHEARRNDDFNIIQPLNQYSIPTSQRSLHHRTRTVAPSTSNPPTTVYSTPFAYTPAVQLLQSRRGSQNFDKRMPYKLKESPYDDGQLSRRESSIPSPLRR